MLRKRAVELPSQPGLRDFVLSASRSRPNARQAHDRNRGSATDARREHGVGESKVSKPPKLREEDEEIMLAALKLRYPAVTGIVLTPGKTGWSFSLSRTTASAGPLAKANRLLAELRTRYTIVDLQGRELDGKL